jgi:hypothetical protein
MLEIDPSLEVVAIPTAGTGPSEAWPWEEDMQRPATLKNTRRKKVIFFINIVLAAFYHG